MVRWAKSALLAEVLHYARFFPDPDFLRGHAYNLSKGGPFPDRTSGMSQYPQIP